MVTEDTERTIGERRLRTLRETGGERTTEEAKSAEGCLPDSRAASLPEIRTTCLSSIFYLIEADARTARLGGATGLPPGSSAAPSDVDLTVLQGPQAAWPLRAVLETGLAEVVTDIGRWLGPTPVGVYPEPPHTAAVMPLRKSGQDRLARVPRGRHQTPDDLSMMTTGDSSICWPARSPPLSPTPVPTRKSVSRAETLAELDRAKTAFFSQR